MRKAIFPKQGFVLTLRFLASRASFRSLEYQFRVSRKTICYIINETCKVIVTVLAGTYLKFPSHQEDLRNIEKTFKEKWNFPHCIGTVDGKHIEIIGVVWGRSTIITKAQTQLFF